MKRILFLSAFIFALMDAFSQDFFTHPEWAKNATIYEVNIRQYTPEGTFRAFEANLPRLKKMGVDILWIMPIYPIGQKERKGSLGSYYAVKDYRAVNPEFGTMDDFKALVKKAHEMGFKVILDWVANHSAPDNQLTVEHPDWYTHDSTGKIIPPVPDWTDVADFNYDNKDLWTYQIESMKFWIKEADVDGFRCDVAMMVPLDFWKEVRMQLDKVKKVFMLAEAEGPEFHTHGFDMTYGWELLHLMNEVAQGKKNAGDIINYFHENDSLFNKKDYRMYFTSNHDENSWNGSEYERMGIAAETFAALTFVIPGMPLIYGGQESGMKKRLKFFDKDNIDWDNYRLADFYQKLVTLKKKNPALWNGDEGAKMTLIASDNKNLLCFSRSKGKDVVFAVFNLSNTELPVTLDTKDLAGVYQPVFGNGTITIGNSYSDKLKPWGYEIFVSK